MNVHIGSSSKMIQKGPFQLCCVINWHWLWMFLLVMFIIFKLVSTPQALTECLTHFTGVSKSSSDWLNCEFPGDACSLTRPLWSQTYNVYSCDNRIKCCILKSSSFTQHSKSLSSTPLNMTLNCDWLLYMSVRRPLGGPWPMKAAMESGPSAVSHGTILQFCYIIYVNMMLRVRKRPKVKLFWLKITKSALKSHSFAYRNG